MMQGLIRRQDAIIAVRSHRIDINDPKKIIRKSYEDVIKELPSAESEIIRCKECKFAHMTHNGECKYCDIWFPDEKNYLDGNYYCASAERKEK